MNHPMPKIVLTEVHDSHTKIQAICKIVLHAFLNKKRMLVTVPNETSLQYVDALLWRFPEDSFLPHAVSAKPSKERILITTVQSENLNQASCLLNLCPVVSPIYGLFQEIYELMDSSDPAKLEISQKKMKDYQQLGIK